jgi:hypothetical protein
VLRWAGPCFCSVNALRHRETKLALDANTPWVGCLKLTPSAGKLSCRHEGELSHPWLLQLLGYTLSGFILAMLAGSCASTSDRMQPQSSVETLQYYPFLVKGYENTYPKRRVMVLSAVDERDFKDNSGAAHTPNNGNPAIGVVRDKSGEILQRLYGPPLEPLVQDSIAQAVKEAGMISFTSTMPLREALGSLQAQYIIYPKIARFWVDKHRGPDNPAGATWFASAEVALDVVVYKAPFDVPFWEGESEATYDDPPPPVAGLAPPDETEIYDDPGQVLSVALTRAAAGIFKREDLHSLISEDSVSPHP